MKRSTYLVTNINFYNNFVGFNFTHKIENEFVYHIAFVSRLCGFDTTADKDKKIFLNNNNKTYQTYRHSII